MGESRKYGTDSRGFPLGEPYSNPFLLKLDLIAGRRQTPGAIGINEISSGHYRLVCKR